MPHFALCCLKYDYTCTFAVQKTVKSSIDIGKKHINIKPFILHDFHDL